MVTAASTRERTLSRAFSALRARQWAHFAVLPLAAVDARTSWGRAGLGVAVACACLAYAYGLNAIADRATDAPEKNPLAGLDQPPDAVRLLLLGAASIALGLAAPLGVAAVTLAVASLVAGTIYSVGPRWKALPVLGVVANTAIFAPLLGLLGRGARLGPLAAVFVGLLVQSQLLHELADTEEDARGGVRTTAQALGARATRRVVVVSATLSAVVAVALSRSLPVAVATVAALVVGTVVALAVRAPAEARAWHRRASVVVGALVFAAGMLP
ncbi:MAG: UbiA family prenyltransferase [Myxococcales bacterium]|nr:UbiA family prenyltransferase [Myxococcales bacterium]